MPADALAFNMNGNPTNEINLNFQNYLDKRNRELSVHLVNGIPDYAFSLDQQLRRKLASIPPVRYLAQAISSAHLSFKKQIMLMSGVAVTPKQYPEIYEMAQECARILGIGTPEIFVKFDPQPNAYTLASSQASDIIVFHSSLIEMTTRDELMFIMGHECGHIHNLHSVYNTAAEILANPAMGLLASAIPGLQTAIKLAASALGLFLKHWSRAAEVTCDRAGAICVGSILAGQTGLSKLATGGGTAYGKINVDELIKQMQRTQATPLRLMELTASHPLIPKRLKALELFSECDVLYKWRPEMRATNSRVRTHEEVDRECAQQIRVL